MRSIFQLAILLVIVFFCCESVAAIKVSNVEVTPSGYLTEGTEVSISFTLTFPTTGDVTTPVDNNLNLYTDLDNPQWTTILFLNGKENTQSSTKKNQMSISGWLLSCNTDDIKKEEVKVSLKGNIPSDADSDQYLVKAQMVDDHDNVVSSLNYKYNLPATPAPTPKITEYSNSQTPETTFIPTELTTSTQTSKRTLRTFTPLPTDTPTEEAPLGIGISILGVALAVIIIRI